MNRNNVGIHRAKVLSMLGDVGCYDIAIGILDKLESMGYFFMPASTKYHGTEEGDLFRHSTCVAEILKDFTDRGLIEWENPRSPIVVGLFHDLCKCDNYFRRMDGAWDYNPNQILSGHGDKSVMIASTLMQLTEEEMLCIRYHMGAYVKDDWNGYDQSIRKYSNVLWTHTADMLASKVVGV